MLTNLPESRPNALRRASAPVASGARVGVQPKPWPITALTLLFGVACVTVAIPAGLAQSTQAQSIQAPALQASGSDTKDTIPLSIERPALPASSSSGQTHPPSPRSEVQQEPDRIDPPIPATPGKVEVILFFSLGSDWSARAWPAWESWKDEGSTLLRFDQAPAVISEDWGLQAREYFALEKVGASSLAGDLAGAIATQAVNSRSPQSLAQWLRSHGVDDQAYMAAVNAAPTKVRAIQAMKITALYGVVAVPTVVVNGKYRIQPHPGQRPEQVIAQARALVGRLLHDAAYGDKSLAPDASASP